MEIDLYRPREHLAMEEVRIDRNGMISIESK